MCNNVPDDFKIVGHKGPFNLLPLLQKLGQLFKTKNGGWRKTQQGRIKYRMAPHGGVMFALKIIKNTDIYSVLWQK